MILCYDHSTTNCATTTSLKMRSKSVINLLEDELHAEPELLVRVNLEVVELVDEDVELLRTKFVQDAASLSRQCCHVVLQ